MDFERLSQFRLHTFCECLIERRIPLETVQVLRDEVELSLQIFYEYPHKQSHGMMTIGLQTMCNNFMDSRDVDYM